MPPAPAQTDAASPRPHQGVPVQQDEERQLQRVRDDLIREFAAGLSEQVVDEHFSALVRDFDGAPVRAFVPVLAQRAARERLRGLPRT